MCPRANVLACMSACVFVRLSVVGSWHQVCGWSVEKLVNGFRAAIDPLRFRSDDTADAA